MTDLILYDGVCGLCNRANRFVLKHDGAERFRFASLQSGLAAAILRKHGRNPGEMSTVVVVADYSGGRERLIARGRAAVYVLRRLWPSARILEILPAPLLDGVYDYIARHRYGWFGRYDTCPLPDPRHRARFLDL